MIPWRKLRKHAGSISFGQVVMLQRPGAASGAGAFPSSFLALTCRA